VTPDPYPKGRAMTTLEREFVRTQQEAELPPKGRTRQRVTHHGLPGRDRREKRLNAKLAQKAFLAEKRAHG
jgi:hypothetical protein